MDVSGEELRKLHDAVEPLAAQVYRGDGDGRWHVRMAGGSTLVLSSDEVPRLHSLLDGVVAMLELDGGFEAAEIERSGET